MSENSTTDPSASPLRAALRQALSRLRLDEGEDDELAFAWAEEQGFKIEERPLYETPMWDGQSFNGNLPGRHLLHDIAHWIIAPPERRHVPDFGLGSGPESCPRLPEKVITEDGTTEEHRAALLGLLLQGALGMRCAGMLEELSLCEPAGRTHRLLPNAVDQLVEPFSWLLTEGHIDVTGRPRIMEAEPAPLPARFADSAAAS